MKTFLEWFVLGALLVVVVETQWHDGRLDVLEHEVFEPSPLCQPLDPEDFPPMLITPEPCCPKRYRVPDEPAEEYNPRWIPKVPYLQPQVIPLNRPYPDQSQRPGLGYQAMKGVG